MPILHSLYPRLIFPLLARVDAEHAHLAVLALLEALERIRVARGVLHSQFAMDDPRLRVSALGLQFPNPIGLAAGFDKDGRAVRTLASLGFGHVEVGTVTPVPQPGRPTPRIFRLSQDRALINRLGFPSRGVEFVKGSLPPRPRGFVLGINVGPNAASVDVGQADADCARCIESMGGAADYFTLNVSSPNTPGLRDLQRGAALRNLLGAASGALARIDCTAPLLVKLSPDLSDAELDETLDVTVAEGVSGVVATNTTISRPDTLVGEQRGEAGGLSGLPLRERSTTLVRRIHERTQGTIPIVAVGGVFTADDVLEKLAVGASLVQLYTGLVYQGPSVARDINRELIARMDRHGARSLAELVDRYGAARPTAT